MLAPYRNHNVAAFEIDRRHAGRRSVQHIGKILIESTAAPQYCLVTETSENGVRVRIYTAPDFETPSVFTLRFEQTEAVYKVIWRNGQFIGAELASRTA